MIKGIVFDLDSTLVQSRIDFPKMKKKIIKLLEQNGHPKDTLSPINQTTVQIRELAEEEWEKQNKPESEREELAEMITQLMDEGELKDGIYTRTWQAPEYFVRKGDTATDEYKGDIKEGRREVKFTIYAGGETIEHEPFYLTKPPVVPLTASAQT